MPIDGTVSICAAQTPLSAVQKSVSNCKPPKAARHSAVFIKSAATAKGHSGNGHLLQYADFVLTSNAYLGPSLWTMAPAKNDPVTGDEITGMVGSGANARRTPNNGNVDDREIQRFSELASKWWDSGGEFAALHKLGPPRLEFIRDQLASRFDRETHALKPLEGLTLLDIGCGGGLITEPLSRLGGGVRGIDLSPEVISVAQDHAHACGLGIDYQVLSAEEVAASGMYFDAVMCLEVLEHVPDPGALVQTCAQLLKPGGLLFLSTLNRTLKSYALAIVGAEYVLGWVPRGAHNWDKFISPDELRAMACDAGLVDFRARGLVYRPFRDEWVLDRDTDVNYITAAMKPMT